MSLFMQRHLAVGLVGLLALSAGPALAQDAAKRRPEALEAVVACRAIADTDARLACFDKAAAGLDEAESRGEVVVVDRGQIREARKAAFGFTFKMPSFMTAGDKPEDLERLTSTIASAYHSGGKWVITLEDGAVWRQIDSISMRKSPKAGSKVEIRTAMLGSFFMKVDGQTAMRVTRDR